MNRPEQHTIADRAVSAVRQIFNDVGFAVDEIIRDYGEDLLVQPSFDGQVDPSRIWVQVKGTRDLSSYRYHGHFAVPISLPHARRWISVTDLVVVVLWDVSREIGFWATPRGLSFRRELARLKPDLRIPFSSADVFDRHAALRLAWNARVANYSTRLAQITSGQMFEPDVPPAELPEAGLIPEMSRDMVALDFLEQLKVIGEDGVAEPYADIWRRAWQDGGSRDVLSRHIRACVRVLDARFDALGRGVVYSSEILAAVTLMLLRTIRPNGALEIAGCDWSGVDLTPLEDIYLIGPNLPNGAKPTEDSFVTRLGEVLERELAEQRAHEDSSTKD